MRAPTSIRSLIATRESPMDQQHILTPVTALVTRPPAVGWRDALPTLVGERVTLRELAHPDAASLVPLLASPEVSRYISAPPTSVEQFSWFIEWSRRERQAGRHAAFSIVPAGEETPAGLLQLRQVDPGFTTAEWGFVLGSAFWGAGIFGEAASLLLDFAFATVGVRRLEARAAAPNARGNTVLRKLGAVQEGVLRRSLVTASGEQFDQVLWSLLADEWQTARVSRLVRVH
jgi:RimJ/RimL family protein N-acetyltransferase